MRTDQLSAVLVFFLAVAALGQPGLKTAKEGTAQPRAAVPAKDDQPVMELGGYITVDYAGQTNVAQIARMSLGRIELGANVNIGANVTGSVVIEVQHSVDSLSLYQALVSYKPPCMPLQFLVGQQTFNHGLLTSRLISDPLIVPDVEIIAPGVSVLYAAGPFTPSASFVVSQHPDNKDTAQRVSDYRCVVACDLALPSKSLIRLSSILSQDLCDVDCALTWNVGKLSIDGELYGRLFGCDSSPNPAGYYAGLLFGPINFMSLAARYDGRSPDRFGHIDQRFSGGLVIDVKGGVFCAGELAYVKPANLATQPYREIRLQIGLRRSLALPGFHRKTLARN